MFNLFDLNMLVLSHADKFSRVRILKYLNVITIRRFVYKRFKPLCVLELSNCFSIMIIETCLVSSIIWPRQDKTLKHGGRKWRGAR